MDFNVQIKATAWYYRNGQRNIIYAIFDYTKNSKVFASGRFKFTSFQHLHNTLTFNKCVGVFPPMYTLCSKKEYYQRKGKKKEAKQYAHILEVRTSMGYKLFLPNT